MYQVCFRTPKMVDNDGLHDGWIVYLTNWPCFLSLPDCEANLDANFELVSPGKDPLFTEDTNFVNLFHHQGRGKQLYKLSKRQPPSKANRSASQSPPPLTKKMPTGTRSKGSAPDNEEITELGKVPRRNKIPTQAKKGNDSSPSEKKLPKMEADHSDTSTAKALQKFRNRMRPRFPKHNWIYTRSSLF